MSNEEEAQIGDLIDTETSKWVTIDTLKKKVQIKKILLGSLGKITKGAGDDPFENLKLMLEHGLVTPKLSKEQIENMKPVIANEIGMAIADFSGLTKEAVERARNLSGPQEATVSG